jgi:hypothetical protein
LITALKLLNANGSVAVKRVCCLTGETQLFVSSYEQAI